jgi:DNA-binding response OmpR family regulator
MTRTAQLLLIEDDISVRQMLERALRSGGYEVMAITSMHDRFTPPEGGFDLVIINSPRPFYSGRELAETVHRTWPGAPILHLDDLTRPLMSALPRDVPSLLKPFSIESLLLAVDHLTANPDDGRQGMVG